MGMRFRRLTRRITATPRRAGASLRHTVTAPVRWWKALEPAERILYRAVVLLGAGFGLVWAPLGLIVPGSLFALVFFGFSLRRVV